MVQVYAFFKTVNHILLSARVCELF